MLVTLCTVCKNRAAHCKQTILKNIKDNQEYGNVEFLLLDYNSDDGLEEWVKENLAQHIESGLLTYYKTFEPLYFHRSHSRNMAFRLAKGDLICNVDADNYTGSGFASYLSEEFSNDQDVFLCAGGARDNIACSDIGGRICIRSEDFWKLGGYDEAMCNYGFEDFDLINRLELIELEKKLITNESYLSVIEHDTRDRITEEFPYRNIKNVMIHYVDPSRSQVLFIFLNGTFALGTLINNKNLYSDKSYRFNNNHLNNISMAEAIWIKGTIQDHSPGKWNLLPDEQKYISSLEYVTEGDKYSLQSDKEALDFYILKKPGLVEEALIFYSETYNRIKMHWNMSQKVIKPNKTNIGAGVVYKNFNYNNPIVL